MHAILKNHAPEGGYLISPPRGFLEFRQTMAY
jgi:hypothetical protein